MANCETVVEDYWFSKSGNTDANPLNHLLLEEIPAVTNDKAKLEGLIKRRQQCKANLDSENKVLVKLREKKAKKEEEGANMEEKTPAGGRTNFNF